MEAGWLFGKAVAVRISVVKTFWAALAAAVLCAGCGGDTNPGGNDNITPTTPGGGSSVCTFDGYKTVEIGAQTWMAENLNCGVEGSKCYDNSPDSCAKYGRLYTWETAKNVCPEGWHLPSDEEWTVLTDYLAESSATKLKSPAGWSDYSDAVESGTDEYEFSALPGGFAYGSHFNSVGKNGNWWSATEHDAVNAWVRNMYHCSGSVAVNYYSKLFLLSVRCVRD